MLERSDAQTEALRAEYVGRINRVLDYIEANLDGDLSLATLARVANFSAYHFHRVFRGVVGETLNQFIQRRLVEKATSFLLANPTRPITDIALDCGFSGSVSFARSFKEAFGLSASDYRSAGASAKSKIGKTNSKDQKTRAQPGKSVRGLRVCNGPRFWNPIVEVCHDKPE